MRVLKLFEGAKINQYKSASQNANQGYPTKKGSAEYNKCLQLCPILSLLYTSDSLRETRGTAV